MLLVFQNRGANQGSVWSFHFHLMENDAFVFKMDMMVIGFGQKVLVVTKQIVQMG